MDYNLVVSARAEFEATSALNYYDNISAELGMRFINELQETYRKIVTSPVYYSFISSKTGAHKFRDLKMKHFPYVVIFEVSGSDVYVASVMDTRRKPDIA